MRGSPAAAVPSGGAVDPAMAVLQNSAIYNPMPEPTQSPLYVAP